MNEPLVTADKETGLPLIKCKHAPSSSEESTPERVAEILLAQEVEWRLKAIHQSRDRGEANV